MSLLINSNFVKHNNEKKSRNPNYKESDKEYS